MIINIIVPLILAVIVARYFEKKKYHLATIAWSTLFIVLSFEFLFTTPIKAIVNMWINLIGEDTYYVINDALVTVIPYTNGGLSAAMVGIISIYIAVPLVSTVIVIKQIKHYFKILTDKQNTILLDDLGYDISSPVFEELVPSPSKKYIVLQKLLN